MNKNRKRTLFIAQFGLLLAIEAVFCFTPLGSLPAIGPIVATLMMVPVVITAILLGIGAGAAMGAFAGLFSFIVWTFMPPNPFTAFLFTPFTSVEAYSGNFGSLLICFAPRTLGGVGAAAVCGFVERSAPKLRGINFGISGAVGSLINTAGVLGGIWLFFGDIYAELAGGAIAVLVGLTVLTSGIPEAILAAVIAAAVCKPVKKIMAT